MVGMPQGVEESKLEEYKNEISVYKSYGERIKDLERKRALLASSFVFTAARVISFVVFLLLLGAIAYLFRDTTWDALLVTVLFYIGLFFIDSAVSNFIANVVSFGRVNKISGDVNKVKKEIEEVKELRKNSYAKLQSFEKIVRDYYVAELSEFFGNNLYKKRSGGQEFETSLSEFSSMIDELSKINSIFVTTHIPLEGHKSYLIKRTIDHSFQSSKESAPLTSVRDLVRSISKPQEPRQKEVIAPHEFHRVARKINWEEINKNRKLTGEQGEEIVVAIEQRFFESINRKDLADRVRHVSVKDGDGLGYDVLSFFQDGREKYIEVKSSSASLTTPFYLSRNELGFLKEHTEDAFIYRILIVGEDSQLETEVSREFLEKNEFIPIRYVVRAK